MIKVCHVISSLKMGGAQQLLFRLSESLDKPEFTHIIICLTGETELAEKFRNRGVKVYNLNMRCVLHTVKCILQLKKILKLEQPSVVHTWLYHADLITTVAMIGIKSIPLVWSIHHANENFDGDKKSTKWLVKSLALMSGRIPTVIIYCSEYAKRVHRKLGYRPKKDIVINNGIDTNRFSPSSLLRKQFRDEFGISKNTLVIGMVARYSPVKGYEVFIDMAHKLLEKNYDIKFVMIGTDIVNTNHELIDTLEKLELSSHTLLLGEREDIEGAMNGMDVLVCPSFAESFGLVVVEALMCEVPVVCSDLEVLRFIAGDDYVTPVGNSHLLANKVNQLITTTLPERRIIGNKGRKRMIEQFDEVLMIEKYKRIYNEISSSNSKNMYAN